MSTEAASATGDVPVVAAPPGEGGLAGAGFQSRLRRFLAEFPGELPPWLFWGIFLGATWFYICRKIVEWDIWWHMAAGKFYLEHGFYPPSDTFTFSPVNKVNGLWQTWLGDILLFKVYDIGGYLGLQLMAAALILCPVLIVYVLGGRRRNAWMVAACFIMVLGTMQQHLIKNAIYSLFFLSVIAWIGAQRAGWRRYLVVVFPLLFWAWRHMHGYVLVGHAVIFLMLAGELLDLLLPVLMAPIRYIFKREWALRWNVHDLLFALVLAASCITAREIVKDDWDLPWEHLVRKFYAPMATWEKDNAGAPQGATREFAPGVELPFHEKARRFFRQVFRGGDAEIVAEYQYPVNIRFTVVAKAMFVFAPLVMLYFSTAVVLYLLAAAGARWAEPWARPLRMSHLLPAIITVHMGMGFLRTVAFPFLIALPWMAHGLANMPWRDAAPLLRAGRRGLEGFLLACMVIIIWKSNYFCWQGKFSRFTGFIDTEVGYGKSLKFKETIPQYALERFRDEKIFNSYNIGGYLIWEWYTNKKVFIDGRSANYDIEFYNDYIQGAAKYINLHKIERALMSLYVDKDRIAALLRENWSPVIFDNSMVILKRSQTLESEHGKVPEFICSEKDLEGMDYIDVLGLGLFARNTLNYLLLCGRLADALEFLGRYPHLFKALDPMHRDEIASRVPILRTLEGAFGRINHPLLGELCDRLYNPKNIEHAPFLIAGALSKLGRPGEAAQAYAAYLETHGNAHYAWAGLSMEFAKLGCVEEAWRTMDQASRIAPEQADYRQGSEALGRVVQADRQARAQQKALLGSGGNSDEWARFAESMKDLGRFEEASQAMEKAVALSPGNADYLNNAGVLHYMLRKWDEAEKYYHEAIRAKPDDPMAYYNLGMLFQDRNQPLQAVELYRKALEVRPSFTEPQARLAALENNLMMSGNAK